MAIKDDEMKRLAMALAPFMFEAAQLGHSMVSLEIDMVQLLGLSNAAPGAGLTLVAIAAGPSIPVLEQALAMAQNPQ